MTKPETYLFEIPVYRCEPERHTAEMDAARNAALAPFRGLEGSSAANFYGHYFEEHKWFPWRYNEIVAWIRVFADGTQVKGELWSVRERITRQLRRKHFVHAGWIFECDPIAELGSNAEPRDVHCHVRKAIKSAADAGWTRRFSIDLECFDNAARYLDWRSILGQG